MTERATFTYVGPDQHIRLGAETFQRHRETLVTDPDTIAAARAHPEVEEDAGNGRVPVSQPVDDLEQDPAPTSALPIAKPKRVRKPKAAKTK